MNNYPSRRESSSIEPYTYNQQTPVQEVVTSFLTGVKRAVLTAIACVMALVVLLFIESYQANAKEYNDFAATVAKSFIVGCEIIVLLAIVFAVTVVCANRIGYQFTKPDDDFEPVPVQSEWEHEQQYKQQYINDDDEPVFNPNGFLEGSKAWDKEVFNYYEAVKDRNGYKKTNFCIAVLGNKGGWYEEKINKVLEQFGEEL